MDGFRNVLKINRNKLVGAVGIEFSKSRNLKELCGLPWRPKSFVVYTRNCRCPRIAP
jgi:hypothetical protein